MTFLQRLFFVLVQGSVMVALSTTSLTVLTYLERGVRLDAHLLTWVFFGTIAAYNFIKFATEVGWRHRSLPGYLRWIQLGSFLATALALWFSYGLSGDTWIWICLIGALVVLYTLPILAGSTLRSLPGIKIFVVAAVWMAVTVIIPMVEAGQELDLAVWNMALRRMLLVLILILPFEIRDAEVDEAGLKTMPTWIGIKNTKRLALVLGLALLLLLLQDWRVFGRGGLMELLITAVAVAAVWRSKVDQPEYFASFWVEGIPVFWLGLWYLTAALTG